MEPLEQGPTYSQVFKVIKNNPFSANSEETINEENDPSASNQSREMWVESALKNLIPPKNQIFDSRTLKSSLIDLQPYIRNLKLELNPDAFQSLTIEEYCIVIILKTFLTLVNKYTPTNTTQSAFLELTQIINKKEWRKNILSRFQKWFKTDAIFHPYKPLLGWIDFILQHDHLIHNKLSTQLPELEHLPPQTAANILVDLFEKLLSMSSPILESIQKSVNVFTTSSHKTFKDKNKTYKNFINDSKIITLCLEKFLRIKNQNNNIHKLTTYVNQLESSLPLIAQTDEACENLLPIFKAIERLKLVAPSLDLVEEKITPLEAWVIEFISKLEAIKPTPPPSEKKKKKLQNPTLSSFFELFYLLANARRQEPKADLEALEKIINNRLTTVNYPLWYISLMKQIIAEMNPLLDSINKEGHSGNYIIAFLKELACLGECHKATFKNCLNDSSTDFLSLQFLRLIITYLKAHQENLKQNKGNEIEALFSSMEGSMKVIINALAEIKYLQSFLRVTFIFIPSLMKPFYEATCSAYDLDWLSTIDNLKLSETKELPEAKPKLPKHKATTSKSKNKTAKKTLPFMRDSEFSTSDTLKPHPLRNLHKIFLQQTFLPPHEFQFSKQTDVFLQDQIYHLWHTYWTLSLCGKALQQQKWDHLPLLFHLLINHSFLSKEQGLSVFHWENHRTLTHDLSEIEKSLQLPISDTNVSILFRYLSSNQEKYRRQTNPLPKILELLIHLLSAKSFREEEFNYLSSVIKESLNCQFTPLQNLSEFEEGKEIRQMFDQLVQKLSQITQFDISLSPQVFEKTLIPLEDDIAYLNEITKHFKKTACISQDMAFHLKRLSLSMKLYNDYPDLEFLSLHERNLRFFCQYFIELWGQLMSYHEGKVICTHDLNIYIHAFNKTLSSDDIILIKELNNKKALDYLYRSFFNCHSQPKASLLQLSQAYQYSVHSSLENSFNDHASEEYQRLEREKLKNLFTKESDLIAKLIKILKLRYPIPKF